MPFAKGHKHGNRFTSEKQPEKKGRPRKPDLIKELEAILLKEAPSGKPVQEILMGRLVKMASDGDLRAIAMVLDRVHGKPKENIEQTITHTSPQVIILPPETDIKPYLNEADVIDPTE
jgi:hypothetical protein